MKNGYVNVNNLIRHGRIMAMKHLVSSVSFWGLEKTWQPWCSQTPALSWLEKRVTADTVCGCRCVLCVYALRHNPVCVYKCVSDFRGVQKMESIFATVFQNYFPWDGAHFLLWKLLHYQYKTHLDLKHCMSTQSRSHVHGQWSSSKLFISMSSQIRISAPWFSCLWKLTHNNLQYRDIL